MPDEQQTQQQEGQGQQQQQQQNGTAPFDAEAFRAQMAETIRAELDARQQSQTDVEGTQDFGQGGYEERQSGAQQEPDPVAKLIAPVVGPALQNVALQAQAAADAAQFYTPTLGEDAVDVELRGKWRGDVEKKFGELMRMGRPTPRADIFAWFKGQRINDVVEAHIKAREAAASRAAMAETAGPGATRTLHGGKSPADMNEEELVAALQKQAPQGF